VKSWRALLARSRLDRAAGRISNVGAINFSPTLRFNLTQFRRAYEETERGREKRGRRKSCECSFRVMEMSLNFLIRLIFAVSEPPAEEAGNATDAISSALVAMLDSHAR